jgi:hypothetical protein
MRRGVHCVLLFVNVVDAQSQPPAPGTGEIISDPQKSHADKTTKRSGTNQRGTKDNPFIIDIVKTGYDDERTDQESKDAHQSAADNRHLVIITGVLAIFACFQWLVMLWQGCLTGFFRTCDFSTKCFEASKDEDYEYNQSAGLSCSI